MVMNQTRLPANVQNVFQYTQVISCPPNQFFSR